MVEDKEQKEGPDVDPFLQNLVTAVNSEETTFAITLNVNGLIVSGALIGGRTYFTEFARQFSKSMSDEDDVEMEEAIKNLGNTYKVYSVDDDSSKPRPRFIHLKDAKFHHPGFGAAIPQQEGVLWRGRLEAVDGFVLGSLHEINIELSEFSKKDS